METEPRPLDRPALPRRAAATGGARARAPAAWAALPPCGAEPSADPSARHARLHALLTKGKAPAPEGESPHLILTLGPPGAGKSTLARVLVKHKSGVPAGAYVEVDVDDLTDQAGDLDQLRNLPDVHGRPTGVGYALGWARCAADEAPLLRRLLQERYHLIIQSHDQQLLIDAQLRGYVCTVLYVAVSPAVALRRAAARAERLGRFVTAEPDTWGWEPAVRELWGRYREQAPWYALWADSLVVVANDVDGRTPAAADFKVYVAHPPLEPGEDWHQAVSAHYAAIAAAHGEK